MRVLASPVQKVPAPKASKRCRCWVVRLLVHTIGLLFVTEFELIMVTDRIFPPLA
jgi:hypothetical protein